MPSRCRPLVLVLGLAMLIGCEDGRPKGDLPPLYPAKGKVVRGGQPVGGGSVRFQPDPDVPDLAVTAEVRADGTFELQTIHALSQKTGPGAPAGSYRVTYYPAAGDQTQGPNPEPVTPARTYTIRDGPNELTVEVGKR